MRALIGIVVGLVAGLIATVVAAIVAIGLFAGGAGSAQVSMADAQRTIEVFEQLPQGAKIGLMLAWLVGAFIGAAVAKLIARTAVAAWVVAGLIAAYVVANVLVLPMPGWMQALSVIAPLLGGFLANHLVAARATAADPDLPG